MNCAPHLCVASAAQKGLGETGQLASPFHQRCTANKAGLHLYYNR